MEPEHPIVARQVAETIKRQSRNLPMFPLLGKQIEGEELRRLVIPGDPFFLVYEVDADRIITLRVFHMARDWPKERR